MLKKLGHNKNNKFLNNKNKIFVSGVALFFVSLAGAYTLNAEFMEIPDTGAVTNVSSNISSNSYYMSVASLGEVNVEVDSAAEEKKGEGTDLLHVETNTPAYKLFISSDNDNNNMYMNGDEASPYFLVPTVSAELDDNSWGYRLATDTSGFKPMPAKGSEAVLIEQRGLTAGVNTQHNHPVIYGARADAAMPAGRYSRTVVYNLAADASPNANTASISHSSVLWEPEGTFQLTVVADVFTNMEFGEWEVKIGSTVCPNPVVSVLEPSRKVSITCDAPKNLAVGYYTVTATSAKYGTYTTGSTKLQYLPPGLYTISKMQDMNRDLCAVNTTPSPNATSFDTTGAHHGDPNYVPRVYLTDTRDSKRYVVQKMADGRCWMVQNLGLAGGITVRPDNTNTPVAWTLPESKTDGWTDNAVAYMYNGSHTSSSLSSKGAYYSWITATAERGQIISSVGEQSPRDICPLGWRLPNGESNGEFRNLYAAYGNSKSRLDAHWFPVYAGAYVSDGLTNSGSNATWWSRTSYYSSAAYTLREDNSYNVQSGYITDRKQGFSIRCIAQN